MSTFNAMLWILNLFQDLVKKRALVRLLIVFFISLFFFSTVCPTTKGAQVSDRARRARIASGSGAKEEAKGVEKEIIVPEYIHGIGYLSTIRNDSIDKLKVESLKFLTKNGKYKKKLEVPAYESDELNLNPKIDQSRIRVKGFGRDIVKGFATGSALKIKASYAWLDKSFKKDNHATISFRAKSAKNMNTQEVGQVTVYLSNNISPNYHYKIVIGDKKNSLSQIIKKDKKSGKEKVAYSIESKVNDFARIKPFQFQRYWVTVSDNLILVGSGDPGQNVFMSFFDMDMQPNIKRVALGAGKVTVDYSNIHLAPDITTQKNWNPYFKRKGNPDVIDKGKYKILKTPFRTSGFGCFSFEAKGESGISVAFGDNFEYQMLIGVDNNSRTVLLKNGKIIASVFAQDNPEIVISEPEKFNRYWISINDGFILFGRGQPGTNLMFAVNDQEPAKISNQIAIGLPSIEFEIGGDVFCKDIKLGPPVGFELNVKQEFYKKTKQLFSFPDSFEIIKPIFYELYQDMQIVGVKDLVLDVNYPLARIKQEIAEYHLMLIIEKTGTPRLEKVKGPKPSPEKIQMARNAFIREMAAKEAIAIGKELQWAAGRGFGGMAALFGSQMITGIGGAIKGEAAGFRAKAKFGFELKDNYGFVDGVSFPAGGEYKPSEQTLKNEKKIAQLLENTRLIKDPALQLETFSYILYLFNDHYLATRYTKKKIFNALEFLFNSGINKLQDDLYYQKLLKLLIDARDNAYLINDSDEKEAAFKKQLYFWANQVSSYLMHKFNKTKLGIKIPPSFGQYFWLPVKLKNPGKGKIYFQAKALRNIFVCLSSQKGLLRNTSIPFYEIVIHGFKGTKSVIRTTSLGRSVTSFSHGGLSDEMLESEKIRAMAKDFKFKRYLITLNDGHITVLENGKKILDWQDQYPIKDLKYIGFSSWDVYVTYRDIRVSNF